LPDIVASESYVTESFVTDGYVTQSAIDKNRPSKMLEQIVI